MEEHKKYIQNLLGLCGRIPQKYHIIKGAICKAVLSKVLRISAEVGSDSVCPPNVCNNCYLTLRQLEKVKGMGLLRTTSLTANTWTPHTEPCQLCLTPPTHSRGQPKGREGKAMQALDIRTEAAICTSTLQP